MDEDVQRKVYWIVAAIIIAIVGILVALIGPNMILYYFLQHNQQDVFLIHVPLMANIILGVGVALVVAFCILMVFERKTIKGLGLISLVIGLGFGYASVTMYNMFTVDEVRVKEPLNEVTFAWAEVEHASFERLEENDETIVTFDLAGDSHEIALPQSNAREIGTIKRTLQRNEVSVEEIEQS